MYVKSISNNPAYRKLPETSVRSLKDSEQIYSDCYLLASLDALACSNNGSAILRNNVNYLPDISLNDLTTPRFIVNIGEKHIPVSGKDYLRFAPVNNVQKNIIVTTFEIAFSKYIKEHTDAKPLICRIGSIFKNYNFEYNLPSNFMQLLTGKKPISIGEKNLNINLKGHDKQVIELFNKMEKNPDFSFVMGTGIKKLDGKTWHCYSVQKVKDGKVFVKNKRGNETKSYSYDEAINKFKYITGYFNEDLNA